MSKGVLYMIPTYLDEQNDGAYIAPLVKSIVQNTQYYLVENIRTARRYISSLKLGVDISQLHFEQLDKNTTIESIGKLAYPLLEGHDMGVISEAGLPGIADPGKVAVSFAHRKSIKVVPLPGPSSIIQALIASGFNGQSFVFHGYLPIEPKKRQESIRKMQQSHERNGVTQIFMETPYRNDKLMTDLLKILPGSAYLSVAAGISSDSEMIKSQRVESWKTNLPNLHKIPTIFCLGNP
ncbi:MAG: SAM-dependent methyltransferase [Cytophagales bacterium]|nr:SAM-dependent methyltransferase [Cytophagales bacterium]